MAEMPAPRAAAWPRGPLSTLPTDGGSSAKGLGLRPGRARFKPQPRGGWKKHWRSQSWLFHHFFGTGRARPCGKGGAQKSLRGISHRVGCARRGLPCSPAPSSSRAVSPGPCGSPAASVLAPASIGKEKQNASQAPEDHQGAVASVTPPGCLMQVASSYSGLVTLARPAPACPAPCWLASRPPLAP